MSESNCFGLLIAKSDIDREIEIVSGNNIYNASGIVSQDDPGVYSIDLSAFSDSVLSPYSPADELLLVSDSAFSVKVRDVEESELSSVYAQSSILFYNDGGESVSNAQVTLANSSWTVGSVRSTTVANQLMVKLSEGSTISINW